MGSDPQGLTPSEPDLDDGDGRDAAVAEALHVDLQAVGVEADGDVELEAGGDGLRRGGDVAGLESDEAGGVVDGVGGGRRLHDAGDGDEDGAGNRLADGAGPGVEGGAVDLLQLEGGGDAVAGADRLVEGGGRALGRAGLEVHGVAPAEADETAAALLEEGDHGVQLVERLDAVAGVPAAAGVGPAGVALL